MLFSCCFLVQLFEELKVTMSESKQLANGHAE